MMYLMYNIICFLLNSIKIVKGKSVLAFSIKQLKMYLFAFVSLKSKKEINMEIKLKY